MNKYQNLPELFFSKAKENLKNQHLLKINNNLEIFYSQYRPTNLSQFKNKKLLAIAGIGNPDNFFKLMTQNNLDIRKKMIFPDHYKFNEKTWY